MMFNPIRHFRNIDAAELDDAFNTLINEINERLLWEFLGPAITPYLDYSDLPETLAGDPTTLKPIKPSEFVNALGIMVPRFLVTNAAAKTVDAEAKTIRVDGYSVNGLGAANYVQTTNIPTHEAYFITQNGLIYELNEVYPDVAMFGARLTTIDDTAAVNRAIAYCLSKNLPLNFSGVARVTANLPGLHDVRKTGNGGVQVAGARVWLATPSVTTPFSQRQTVYLDPVNGDDANVGVAPGALAIKTPGAANTILAKYGRLVGNWSITIAAGEITTGAQFFGSSNKYSAPLYVEGPSVASPWNNTTPPANADETGGSVPLVVFRPPLAQRGANAGWALDFQRDLNVVLINLKGRDWGDYIAGGRNEGFCRVGYRGALRVINVHCWNNDMALCARDGSFFESVGGICSNNYRPGFFVSSARYTYAIPGASPGTTLSTLIRQSTLCGIDIWEDGSGHPDHAVFEDNPIHVFVRKGGHAAAIGTTFRNTGAFGPSVGMRVQDGANYAVDPSCIWSGTHTPRVQQLNFGSNNAEAGYANRQLVSNAVDQVTSGTTALQIASLAFDPDTFVQQPQAIKVRAFLALNNLNGAASIVLRNGGAFVFTMSIPLQAGARTCEVDIDVFALTDATQRITASWKLSNSTGTAPVSAYTVSDTTVNFAAAVTLNVQLSCANAADTVTSKVAEIWRRG